MAQHGEALDFDLLTQTGCSLGDLYATLDGREASLTLHALLSFVRYAPPRSQIHVARGTLTEEERQWSDQDGLSMLLAQLSDQLAGLSYMYETANSKNSAAIKKPEPIERPGVKKSKNKERHFGSGAIPIRDFDEWWNTH